MEPKVNYIIVGIFVLLLSMVLIGIVLWLSTGGPRPEYSNYVVYINESVSGLSVDSPVKFRGVDVGRVTNINVNSGNVEKVKVTLEVLKKTPITKDTVAQLETQGLTGISFINLTGGTQDAPLIHPSPIPPYTEIESAPSLFTRLDESVSRLLKNLIVSSERLNELLNKENRQTVNETLSSLRSFASQIATHSEQIDIILKNFAETSQSTNKAGKTLNDVLKELGGTIKELETMTTSITQTSKAIEQSATATGAGIERISDQTLPILNNALVEITQAVRSLQQLSKTLERDPSAVIYGTPRTAPGPGERQ